MGDFNAKVGKKQAEDYADGEYGNVYRNARRKLFVEFAARISLWILNTFFRKWVNHKWTWRRPNGKNESKIG